MFRRLFLKLGWTSKVFLLRKPFAEEGGYLADCAVMKTDAEIWKTIKMYRTIRKAGFYGT